MIILFLTYKCKHEQEFVAFYKAVLMSEMCWQYT